MSPVLSSAIQLTLWPLRLAGMFLMIRITLTMFGITGSILRPVISLVGLPLIVNVILVIVVGIKLTSGEVASIPNEPPSNNGGGALSVTTSVKKMIKNDNSRVITILMHTTSIFPIY